SSSRSLVSITVLMACIAAVYGPAISVPFVFDDQSAIVENVSIRSLWPLLGTTEDPGPLRPPRQIPTSGRPLVNLTFALNYHFGGTRPTGYHAINVAIHILSAILLWNIVRRALRLPYFADRYATSADWLALATAVVWALHPLQTEAVIYTAQRTELM